MENVVFTQLSIPEIRQLFRQELQTFFESQALQNSQSEADEFLTIQQAAGFLKLSVPTIRRLVSRSAIPVSKRGKRLYFSKQNLATWAKKSCRRTGRKVQAAAKTGIGRKAKGMKPNGNTKQTQGIKKTPERKSKLNPITYKRGKTEISGTAEEIKGLAWTDLISFHFLRWFLIVLLLCRS